MLVTLNVEGLYLKKDLSDAVSLLQSTPAEEMTAESYLELGTCLKQLNRLEESRTALLHAFDLGPDSVPVIRHLSKVTSMLGRHDEAAEYLERILKKIPESIVDVYPVLVRALLAGGQPEKALGYCNNVLKINPALRFALALKYISLSNMGDVEGAYGVINTED